MTIFTTRKDVNNAFGAFSDEPLISPSQSDIICELLGIIEELEKRIDKIEEASN